MLSATIPAKAARTAFTHFSFKDPTFMPCGRHALLIRTNGADGYRASCLQHKSRHGFQLADGPPRKLTSHEPIQQEKSAVQDIATGLRRNCFGLPCIILTHLGLAVLQWQRGEPTSVCHGTTSKALRAVRLRRHPSRHYDSRRNRDRNQPTYGARRAVFGRGISTWCIAWSTMLPVVIGVSPIIKRAVVVVTVRNDVDPLA